MKKPTFNVCRHHHQAPAQVFRTLEYLDVTPELVAYKLTNGASFTELDSDGQALPENMRNAYAARRMQGLALKKNVVAFVNDRAEALVPCTDMLLVPAKFLDDARTLGYMPAFDKHSKALDKLSDVFDALSSGKADLSQVVRSDVGGHMLFDRFGEVLPTAVHFDYMQGRVTDGVYRLELLVRHLESDPRVLPAHPRTPSQKSKLDIKEVPYYNWSPGCQRHVPFVFCPTQQDMQQMWAAMKKLNRRYPSTAAHEAIFKLDVLGLRKSGAAKHKEYWGTDESAPEAHEYD